MRNLNRISLLVGLGLGLAAFLASEILPGELQLDYSTYLGGEYGDEGNGITVGGDGKIYIVGDTASNDFPTQNPYQSSSPGGSEAFVSVLESDGSSLAFSTYLGGGDNDYGKGICLGPNDKIYLAGWTLSTDFPLQNPYQSTLLGSIDVFVTALTSDGSDLYYSTYLGGWALASNYGYGICVDSSGAAYVVGETRSNAFPTVNPFQASLTGNVDTFLSIFSPDGSTLTYSTYLGGSQYDHGRGISRGDDGRVYLTGYTSSPDFPMENSYQDTYGGDNYDVFVTAFLSTGAALSYSTYLGGSSEDEGLGISLETDGSAFVTGYTTSGDFPTANPFQAGFGGQYDAFVSALNPSGSALTYSTYLGGSLPDRGLGVSVGPEGQAWVTGWTGSSNFPTRNSYQAARRGDHDIFISALAPAGSTLTYSTYLGGGRDDEGQAVVVGSNQAVFITGETWSDNFPTRKSYQGGLATSGFQDAFVCRMIIPAAPSPTLAPPPSATPTPTITVPPTPSPVPTASPGPSAPPTATPAPTASPTPTVSPAPSAPPTATPAPTVSPTPSAIPTPTVPILSAPPWITDYNGDGTSDIAVFRPAAGLWAVRGLTRVYFGGSSDETVPGDYDGDGTTDIGIYRPASGLWAIRGVTRIYFGGGHDIPEPGDYNGDLTDDIGIFRSGSGLWAVRGLTRVYFGSPTDTPIPGYYIGDAVVSIGIYRPASGLWAIRGFSRCYFGSGEDRAVPGDYDGDWAWDFGIFRGSSGLWAIRGITRSYFGTVSDEPVPADYDGSGMDDIGIFRKSSGLWAIRGVSRVYFGSSGDHPVTR